MRWRVRTESLGLCILLNFWLEKVYVNDCSEINRFLSVKADSLPFRVKLPNEAFFDEGDVAEVSTLVEVDDAFVLLCAEVIHNVSTAILIEDLDLNG